VSGADGAHDWTGFAQGAALPVLRDPASGHLLNGNERTAAPDFPVFLGRDWPGDWRAQRIRALLDARPKLSPDDFTRMQADDISAFAAHLLPLLRAAPLDLPPNSLAARARHLLDNWNGAMDSGSPQPLVFNAWVQRFVALAEQRNKVVPSLGAPWEDLASEFFAHPAPWCGGDCTPLLRSALLDGPESLRTAGGDDPASWRWGKAHHAVFSNAFLDAIPLVRVLARAEIPVSGDDSTLFRGGSDRLGEFSALHGGAYRGVYDLADPENSRFIVTPGQSGNWLSPLAWNLMRKWSGGTTIFIGKTPERVDARVELRP
jgi:penicillin G amidase